MATMFVRTKTDRERKRTRVQIVRSVRDGDKVRQKVVRHVGIANSDADIEPLRKLARTLIEEMRQAETPQGALFSPRTYADLAAHRPRQTKPPGAKPPEERLGVDLGQCREEARLSLGVREAFGEMYRLLGWDRLLGPRRMSANRILKDLVVARLAQPRSKRGSVMDMARDTGVTLNLDRVYQTMDLLDDKRIDELRAGSHAAACKLFERPLDVLFYDTTTLAFASENEDELRLKGYSKDGKPHRVQVLLALLVTPGGLPVGYELFPGNSWEGHTLIEALDALQQRYPATCFTVVADAGMLSRDNQLRLEARNIPYILGFRIKAADKTLRNQALDPDGFQTAQPGTHTDDEARRYKTLNHDGKRIVVTYSHKRARKDAHKRSRAIDRLAKRLKRSRQPASLTNRGYARFLDIPDGKVTINENKIADAARWDGISAIVAHGNHDLDPQDLIRQYRGLWEIEACFRTNKHDLKIRPVFHWAPRRIKAHIAICYMAFCCLQHLRHRLATRGHPMSPEALRRTLNTLQVSVLAKKGSQDKYVMPSPASAEARRIYRSLNLTWSEQPFALTQ